jgi:hypothetical protein
MMMPLLPLTATGLTLAYYTIGNALQPPPPMVGLQTSLISHLITHSNSHSTSTHRSTNNDLFFSPLS